MHFQCLAVAGLLANIATAEGQRHKRKVTEGYVYEKRVGSGSGASITPTTYGPGPQSLPSDSSSSSSGEFNSALFQYAPATTTTVTQTSTGGSVFTALATLQSNPTSVSTVNASSAPLTTAPISYSTGYSTGTTTAINSTDVTTHSLPNPPFPYVTGSGYHPNTTSSTAICTGQTLNVLGASLDWWYAVTYTYVASIFSVVTNTNGSGSSWSLITPITSFDVTSALASSCASSLVWNPTHTTSLYTSSCSATPGPVAASTTVITQTAYKSLNVSTGTGSLPDVATQPTPAAVTVASQTSGYSAGVPFVFFSAYEIMSKSPQTYQNGSVGCAETTQRFDMPEPFSFEYEGGDANGSLAIGSNVVGDVNPAFLQIYNIDAAAGSWVAAPTVVVVVEKVFAAQSVLSGETQVTATSLILPSPTLPSFTTPVTPSTSGTSVVQSSAYVESSDTGGLIVPTTTSTTTLSERTSTDKTSEQSPPLTTVTFVAHQESTAITLDIPAPPTQTVITTMLSGELITATALSVVQEHSGNSAPDQTTAQDSTAVTQSSPTNALEVLTDALTSQGLGSAILAGLGVSGTTALPAVVTDSPDTKSAAANVPEIVVGSQTFTANAATQFSFGSGTTLTAGGNVVISGTTISLASNANTVVVNGVTSALSSTHVTNAPDTDSAAGSAPQIVVGSQTFTANAATQFSLGPGATLTAGGKVVVSGTTISLATNAKSVVVNGVTSALSSAQVTPAPLITIGSTVYQGNAGSTFDIHGSLLTPGGHIVVAGTTISLAEDASSIVVDGTTEAIGATGSTNDALATITAPPVLYVDGTAYAANGGTTYLISGSQLTPGGSVILTNDGAVETISLNSAADAVITIVDGTTITSPLGAEPTAAPILTIDGERFTAISGGTTYVIDGKTLTPGGVETVTVSGQTFIVSLSPYATVLQILGVGSNGQVTSTTLETLFPAPGAPSTVYMTVGAVATASQAASAISPGASSTGNPTYLLNDAQSVSLSLSGLVLAAGSFALAIWL